MINHQTIGIPTHLWEPWNIRHGGDVVSGNCQCHDTDWSSRELRAIPRNYQCGKHAKRAWVWGAKDFIYNKAKASHMIKKSMDFPGMDLEPSEVSLKVRVYVHPTSWNWDKSCSSKPQMDLGRHWIIQDISQHVKTEIHLQGAPPILFVDWWARLTTQIFFKPYTSIHIHKP